VVEDDECIPENGEADKDDGWWGAGSLRQDEKHETRDEDADGDEPKKECWMAGQLVPSAWRCIAIIVT